MRDHEVVSARDRFARRSATALSQMATQVYKGITIEEGTQCFFRRESFREMNALSRA